MNPIFASHLQLVNNSCERDANNYDGFVLIFVLIYVLIFSRTQVERLRAHPHTIHDKIQSFYR